jgi:hypothetical protein
MDISSPAAATIRAELSKSVEEADKAAAKTVRDWVKAAAKKTCPRCGGKGVRKNERVVYAGVLGGCYECDAKGEVPVDAKGLKAVTRDAELARLRSQWKAYKKAVEAINALPAYRMQGYEVKELQRQMANVEAAGKAL